jgi:hypothetical protein
MDKLDIKNIEISYIADYDRRIPEDVSIVEADSDYVKVCQLLREKAESDSALKIWVRKKSHFIWLQNFSQLTRIKCTFSEKTPRLILAEEWNVSIPEWLDDETVLCQNLLDLDIPEDHPNEFVDVILESFLGEEFLYNELKDKSLSAILMTLVSPERKKSFAHYPVLSRCVKEKIKKWKDKTNKDWIKKICDNLLKDPENLWKELSFWGLLSKYPEKLLEYVLPLERVQFLRSVPFDAVIDIPLNPSAEEQSSTQIKMFFKELSPITKSRSDFLNVVKCVSGRLKKEIYFLIGILSADKFEIDSNDIELIQNKFKNCLGINTAKLKSLERFVKQKRPQQPDESWDSKMWIKWISDDYIPFRHWQTQTQHYDSQIEDAVKLFSDWYINEYEKIHKDKEKSLVHLLSTWEDLKKEKNLSLLLLVDSLPLTFWELLLSTMKRAGFHLHDKKYYFVPLPSYTKNTKTLMLSGKWELTDKNYESILKQRSKDDWGSKDVIYLPNLKALTELDISKESIIILLNFLHSDEILHSNVEEKSSTFEEELYRLFSRLADSSKSLLDKWKGKPEHFTVYVITDHGAAKILNEEMEFFESKIINKIFSNERYRFSVIKKSEADKIPSNLWDFGYRFSQPFIKEDLVYFIPKGHNTVKVGGAYRGYAHGGASPEEVLVPAAVFKPIKLTWKEPALRFIGLKIDKKSGKAVFYIQRIISIKIEIQNPNSEPIRILQVNVLSPRADVKGYSKPEIGGEKSEVISVDCYFNKAALEEGELIIQIIYEISGEEYTISLKAAAEFKSASAVGFNLKDLKKK